MNVCKHPNNIETIKRDCDGNNKYNICYGEGTDHSSLKELEEYYHTLEKNAELNEELTNVYTDGCWENKTNKPFLKDFNKLDVKDPIQCLIDDNKWITGDGYIIKKGENASDLKNETASKIDIDCSPGYEGDPIIEIDKCENYKDFKDGDKGEYQQFILSGCNKCPLKYGGNRINKDDKTCYSQCGIMGTTLFENSNSNDKLSFIDTKKEFKNGEKRAGYCCNHVANSLSIEGIPGTEKKNENSNYLECRINKCKDGYIKNNTNTACCSKIHNSKDNIEYSCDYNSENTEPINKEVNFCNDGFYPFLNEHGKYSCKTCNIDSYIHPDANTTCDIDGLNIKIKLDSQYKCVDDGLTYYNESTNECVKCPHNMKLNDNYDSELKGSNICICKGGYLVGESCFQCQGENINYNEEYPENNDSKCKCVIDKIDGLSENVLSGDCEGKTLYNGETCNLTCKDGYNLMGTQPRCLESSFDIGTIKCTKGDKKEGETMDENTDETMDETMDENTGETMDENTDETMDENTGENMDETMDENTGETMDENTDENTGETMDETMDENTDENTGETMDENTDETNVVIEGFTNIFSYIQINTNTKRLFLLFLLIILILYL